MPTHRRAAAAPPPETLDDLLERLAALEDATGPRDGTRWYTRLYREATGEVAGALRAGDMEDPAFLERLGVVCGAAYLGAVEDARRRRTLGRAWAPLFEARRRRLVAPLQFAIAGLNAHVNHDLAVGLAATWPELGSEPDDDGPQRRDFNRLNALIERAEGRVKEWLVTGAIAELDTAFGDVDDVAATWSVGRARDAAWTNGALLWHVRGRHALAGAFELGLARSAGLAGRLLLVPTALG